MLFGTAQNLVPLSELARLQEARPFGLLVACRLYHHPDFVLSSYQWLSEVGPRGS
jgi:hypothetical protein